MKNSLPVLIFFFISTVVAAQQHKLDSLDNLLKHHKTMDTLRFKYLIQASETATIASPDRSLAYALEAKKIAANFNNDSLMAQATLWEGGSYYFSNDLLRALDIYHDALGLAETLESRRLEYAIINNIANIYADLGNYEKALEFYNRHLVYSVALKSVKDQIIAESNIGALKLEHGKPREAIATLDRSLKLAKQKKYVMYQTVIEHNLGESYEKVGDFDNARQHYQNALVLAEKLGLSQITANSLNGLAKVNLAIGSLDLATAQAGRSLALAQSVHVPLWESNAWETLSKIFEKQENPDALHAYKEHIKLRDSVLANEKKIEISRKEMQYKMDNQQQIAGEELTFQKRIKNTAILSGSLILLLTGFGIWQYKKKRDAVELQKTSVLEATIAESKLQALRAQISPHFIFNSLNAVRYYIAEKHIGTADEYLMTFASLIRSVLKNSEKEWIPLTEELDI